MSDALILKKLSPKDVIWRSGLTVNNTNRKVITLDPAGKKVRIDRIVVDASHVTATLTGMIKEHLPDGAVLELSTYTVVVATGKADDLIDGAPLITDNLLDIYLQNGTNESVAWNVYIYWTELDDNPPVQLDQS
jgi:hypothetical protein